ncbi:MAG: hypothetical protein Q9204_001094 [Flavoplaca sp. TL-2023a]
MGMNEIRTALKVDLKRPAADQPGLHNRWHPDIPFNGTIKDGEVVKIECVDWTGGQIGNNDSADDMKNIDLTKIHYLSGPFEIETAEPGDVLVVEIQDVQPFQDQPWGFTGVFTKENGGGFLDDIYPEAAKAIWDFEGIFCSSRHIPHVRFPGLIHPGILGCAPSAAVLSEWNRREGELISTTTLERIVAKPPEPKNVHAGSATGDVKAKVGKEGARTIPGRPEHGGNCDIKNLSRGSNTFLPVHVKGAKFSVGDLHFSQGDGEISFCGAIEMAGVITLKLSVMKNGMAQLGMKSPIFLPGPVEPHYGPGRYLTFEGFSVDENGKQHYMDATVAYRQTTLRCIEYLRRFGKRPPPTSFKLDRNTIKTDLGGDRPLYILSAYGPGRDAPQQLFGGQPREQSFEELRLRHYELASAGNEAQAIHEAQLLYSNAEQQIKNTLEDLDGAIKYITDAAGHHPNRLDICQTAGGHVPSLQSPPSAPQPSSGAFPPGPAFGKPSFAQSAMSNPAPAFGQPSFGQPAAPVPVSSFGKPSFGQAATPATAFGQTTNLGQQSVTSGQPSNAVPSPVFGQSSAPSLFGQAQQATQMFGQQQKHQQPAFGQSSNPFGQQSSARPQQSGTFGDRPTPATSNPFTNASKPTIGRDQATAASSSPFGQSAVPQPSGIFGQSATSQTTSNPFGSKDHSSSSGVFGQQVPASAPAFGKPEASASTGILGRPSAPPTSTGAAPQSNPAVSGGHSNTAASLTRAVGGVPVGATFGPGKAGDRRLLTWQGHKVQYIDDEPCVKTAGDGGYQRIWFPEGAPTFTSKTQEYPEEYVVDEGTKQNFKHFLQHGVGSDGLIPDMPPPRGMLSWDF